MYNASKPSCTYTSHNWAKACGRIDHLTCLFPLEPRCGVAKVIKFMGSKPAILASWGCSGHCTVFIWPWLEEFPERLERSNFGKCSYSLPIAYLATRPPNEWATKEIFRTSGLCLTTPNTCIKYYENKIHMTWLLCDTDITDY